VVGRDWERWRALVAVARLFERHGVAGLERDVRTFMAAYHAEQGELESQSRVILVIRALMCIAGFKVSDVWTFPDVTDVSSARLQVTASQVVETLKGLMSEDDDQDDEAGDQAGATPWFHSSRSVGKVLAKLRLKQDRDTSTRQRDRYKVTTPKEILQIAIAHHLVRLSEETSAMSGNVQTSEETREWSA
jgi:hypothetical protein